MRLNKKQWLMVQLAGLLLITGAFLAIRPHLARAVSVNPNLVGAPMEGYGLPGDPYLITTCEQLQDVSSTAPAYSYFDLANDIDCSATSTWNSGSGFIALGSNTGFSGHFDGHGHTISNLTINNNDNYGNTGLFAQTDTASILNVSLQNASITGSGDNTVDSGTGGIIGNALATLIHRVTFEGDITNIDCSSKPNVGGLIGRASTDAHNVTISTSSALGNITVEGTSCGDYTAGVGGLVGLVDSPDSGYVLENYDVYSQMNITLHGNQQTACSAGICRAAGGLFGAIRGYNRTLLYNGYSASSIEITDTSTQQEYQVGGIVGMKFAPITTGAAFSATSFNLPTTCEVDTCLTNAQYYGALTGRDFLSNANTIADFSYDAGLAPNDSCHDNTVTADCTAYNVGNADPAYMKGNTTHGALAAFDFTTFWQVVANDYPVLKDNPPAYPAIITNLSTNVLSTNSIEVTWEPGNPPSELGYYAILCKKSSATDWTLCAYDLPNTATSAVITGGNMEAATSYDFRVVPSTSDYGYAGEASAVVSGTTATPGFTLVSSCQDLQNMNNDLNGYYELSRSLDCAETATWNSGAGFNPIGGINFADYSGVGPFRGIFKGNNYTISNLYSDQTANGLTTCGFFGYLDGNTIIQDVRLDNPTCLSNSAASNLAAVMLGSGSITNVHINNGTVGGPAAMAAGGLAGVVNSADSGTVPISVTKSSFQGTIQTHNPMYLGGLMGGAIGSLDIQNNYSNASIVTDAASSAAGFAGVIAAVDGSVIKHNYSTGSLDITSSDPDLNHTDSFNLLPDTASLTGGFVGVLYGIQSGDFSLTENFTHTALSSQSPENIQAGFLVIAVAGYTGPFDNYFDADLAGTTDCLNGASPVPLSCTGITGQPNYFKNNSTNAPLNTWDFDNIWMTTSELPVFGTKVTTGITTVAPPTTTPNTTCINSIFSLTKCPTTPGAVTSPDGGQQLAASVVKAGSGTGTANATSTPADEVGILGAVKHFVRNLPAAVIVGFPYALFLLLGIAALVLLVELVRELRRLHILQALIHKQQMLAEERDAFWHLAANYLRAPVTLIVGGAEALHDVKSTTTTISLMAIATMLQAKVGDIMQKIEGSTSLQAISQVQPRRMRSIARRALFIIPVVTIAVLTLLGDYAATSYRNMSPGVTGYAMQLAGFVLATVLFYWILSLLTQGKNKRQAAESLLERQTGELANARHELIEDTARSLNPDLTTLEGTLKQLTPEQAALEPTKTLQEGTSRLREIVTSFALLIKVQEGAGAVNATSANRLDLSTALNRVRSKLTPQITAKGVRVVAPALPLAVAAEATMANQVLESIISNAVDYSPANGTVKVEARQLQDKIQLRISDEGKGIDKKQLDHLFQPFTRADGKSAMDMSHGGFGINLYLDKLIMEQMGGTISAASTPGKGTAITMEWPTA